ncbi:MAG: glycerol kinase GlpK [Methylohalobius crimeensis]
MRYILALDQGTTSSRAIVCDRGGGIRAMAQKEFPQYFPRSGWVEHDPEEIWSSQRQVAREALAKAHLRAEDIAALGIANQRETTLIWDRATGEPIHNAIVWQDRRSAGLCDRLRKDGVEPVFQRKTGLILDPYFAGSKIRWLLDRVPGARQRAEAGKLAFGTVDSWLIWKFTQGRCHFTDVTNASRTLLYNIHTGDWDEELLRLLKIPRELLPEVRASSEVYAETSREIFSRSLPIAGIAGDQQAALFGQICTEPGLAKNTYGTGCFVLLHTGDRPVASRHHLLTTVAWKIGSRTDYALEGSVFIAGAVVQWLRDQLGFIRRSEDVESLAARVADSGGVYLVPAFAGLGAPHWDPYARGTLVGLSRGTGAAHIARAALESIAHQSVDVIRAMEADAGLGLSELRVDGGAARNDLLMQLQADLLGVPVVRPRLLETTALGAAYLAGLAVGYWKDIGEIAAHWKQERSFEPRLDGARRLELRTGWDKALQRAKAWADT